MDLFSLTQYNMLSAYRKRLKMDDVLKDVVVFILT